MPAVLTSSQVRALPTGKASTTCMPILPQRHTVSCKETRSNLSLEKAAIKIRGASIIVHQAVATVTAEAPAEVATTETVVVEEPEAYVQDPVELEEVAAQFGRWNDALKTLDPVKVADLYSSDAVLLPTVQNQVRTSRQGIIDYFQFFLQFKPHGIIDESQVRILAKGLAANSGVYTFYLQRNGRDEQVQARFSFMYRKVAGDWKIVKHHSSAMPESDNIQSNFDVWNDALATGDPEKVADCYAPGAVLLPTVSNKVRTSRQDIVDYFTSFLKLKPQGVIDQANVRVLAKDVALYAGIYTFTLHKETGPTKVQARFSYLYKKINGQWKIMEHHSSAMPEKTAVPASTAAPASRAAAAPAAVAATAAAPAPAATKNDSTASSEAGQAEAKGGIFSKLRSFLGL